MTVLLPAVALAVCAAMAGAWAIQRMTGNSGWVDAIWSLTTGAAGATLALWPLDGPPGWRQWLVAALAAAWALRLGGHIALRSSAGKEDVRYAALREEWGAVFHTRLFWFLQIQAVCAFVLALSVLVAARNPAPDFRLADAIGIAILLLAVGGEGLADAQLRRFRADPANRGGVCQLGLWSWSRHPNYFFEWLVWTAWPFLAIGPWGWGWVALSGPVLMYWLLVHASGIPPSEALMVKSRGRAFLDYQARVSAFFPWPPRAAGPKRP